MSTSEDHQDQTQAGGPPPSGPVVNRRRRSFSMASMGLFFRNSGQRSAASATPISTGEIVNGLDRRELRFSALATVLGFGLAIYAYYWGLHSSNPTLKAGAGTYLVAMLIVAFMLGLGTVLRRRAMVGFSALFFGLEQISFDSRYAGFVFLIFGGWLIWRVAQKSKADRALGIVPAKRTANNASKAATDRKVGAPMPKASKRYTPPKASRSARR